MSLLTQQRKTLGGLAQSKLSLFKALEETDSSSYVYRRDEIYQYKKMRFSNAEKCRDESVTYENMLSGSSSLLLASLTRERQMVSIYLKCELCQKTPGWRKMINKWAPFTFSDLSGYAALSREISQFHFWKRSTLKASLIAPETSNMVEL